MRVTLVSAGMLSPKKVDHPFARRHLYLNYGLLALASELDRRGHETRVVHGRFHSPAQFVRHLFESKLLDLDSPLFLSIPSSYALGWSREFCALIKAERPNQKIIIGGRWVVGIDGKWIKRRIPQADLIVYGLAERRVERILYPSTWDTLSFCSKSSDYRPELPLEELPRLNYSLLDQFEDYQPSIEISRGCGMGCSFCVEKDSPLSQPESTHNVIETILSLCAQYRTDDIRPYFEASYFRPSFAWAKALEQRYRENGLRVRWRCESRVDGISPRTLKQLAQAGLKVIDLGLESASPRQLRAMKKATVPAVYLKRASSFIKECKKVGVWVKVNVLLYPGEDKHSIQETAEWLDLHREFIKGLSVGPLVLYRHDTDAGLRSLQSLGATLVSETSLEKVGFGNLHLSADIDHEAALWFSTFLCREFMSARDYYDLKSFSYLPRSYTFSDFQQSLRSADSCALPFRIVSEPSCKEEF